MTVLDVDDEDPKVKRDAWFAYVMPTQTGVEMVGSGRYGYWEERPKVTQEHSDGGVAWRIEGSSEEPILLVTKVNTITAYIAQAKHLEAMPLPQLQEGPS
jgi:hypothetical protein